jgi:hydrogenase maturation protease
LKPGSPRLDAPGDRAGGVLVIGYGNTLRSDDGVGWRAAVLIASDPRLEPDSRVASGSLFASDPRVADVEVRAVHQLTPELAYDMSRASLVILIDASVDDPPGAISVRPLEAGDEDAGGSPGASSHHVGPRELLAVARELYGAAPALATVRIGVASMEVGESLSPEVAAALPAIADAVIEIVVAHRRSRAARPPR